MKKFFVNVGFQFVNVLLVSVFLCSNAFAATFLEETLATPGKKNAFFLSADFDQNGSLDFLFSGFDGQVNSTRIQYQNNDRFVTNNYKSLPTIGEVKNGVVLDSDLDGQLEIILVEKIDDKSTLQLYSLVGNEYKNINSVLNTVLYDSVRIEVCDFNFDTYPDILVFGLAGNQSEVILFENNKGDGFWETKLELPNNPALSFAWKQEAQGQLLWSSVTESALYTLTTAGDLVIENTNLPFIQGEVSWKDVTNNGNEEVFVNGSLDENPFSGLLNESFQPTGFNFLFTSIKQVTFIDVNGDSKLDALVNGEKNGSGASLFYVENTGVSFAEAVAVDTFSTASVLSLIEEGESRVLVSGVKGQEPNEEYLLKEYQLTNVVNPLVFPENQVFSEVDQNSVTLKWPKLSSNVVNYRFGVSKSTGEVLNIRTAEKNAYSNWKDTAIVLNLDAGDYTFSVQAFDVHGNASEVLTKAFSVENLKTNTSLFRSVYLAGDNKKVTGNSSELMDLDQDGDLDFWYAGEDGFVYVNEQEEMNVFSSRKVFQGSDLTVKNYGEPISVYYLKDERLWSYNSTESLSDSLNLNFIENFVTFDFDKDGDLDVFIDSKQTETSLLYTNEEGRLEQSSISFQTKNSPWLVADLDNNGFEDIITKEENNLNRIAWNDGKTLSWGVLNNKSAYEIISTVDFDGDKDLDLLCYRSDDHVYFILVNNGGVFSTSTAYEIYTQDWEYEDQSNRDILIELINVDSDAAMEVLYVDQNTIKVYDNSPSGYYSSVLWEESHGLDLQEKQPVKAFKQGDVNKDGITDVFLQVVLSSGKSQELILYGQQKVIETNPQLINTTLELAYNNVELKWDEVFGASHYLLDLYSKDETLLSSGIVNGKSTFADAFHSLDTVQTFYNLIAGEYYWQVHAVQKDIVVGSSVLNSFAVSSFNAVDITSILESNPQDDPGGVFFSKPCDFDNDGDLDFLFLGTKREPLPAGEDVNFIGNNFIYINQGDSTFVTKKIDIDDVYTADVEFFDFNKDGYQDIVVNAAGILLINTHWEDENTNGGVAQFFTKIYLNDKNNNFYDAGIDFPKIGMGKVDVADYNLDGLDDLLISGRDSIFEETGAAYDKGKGERNWYTVLATNTGEGFDFDTIYSSKRNITAYFQDTDNDNDADILLLGGDYKTQSSDNLQWVNDGGIFKPLNTLIQGYPISYIDYGDYDRDGDLDLLVLGAQVNNYLYQAKRDFDDGIVKWNLSIYKNQGNNLFVPVSQNIEAYIPPTYIHQIHWLDINNDGALDIVLQQDDQVFMIEQTSKGSFVQAKSMHIKDEFTFSTYGDFNDDSKIDFAIGGRESQFKVYFSNIEAENEAPAIASGFKAEITNDECLMSWKNNGDDLTPNNSLRYGITLSSDEGLVYSNITSKPDSSELYKNGLINTGFKLTNLEDGEYKWKIAVIDDNYKASKFSAEQSFSIHHNPTITGAEDTCQFTQSVYAVTPSNQNYLWHVDTAVVAVLDSLTANKVELSWKKVGVHQVIVENVDYNKWDTLWVEVRANEKPVFNAELENDSSKTKMIFNDLVDQEIQLWSWDFIEQEIVLTDSVVVYDFQLPENYPIGLQLTYKNGCVNYAKQDVLVRSPKIFGEDELCFGAVEIYEVFPSEFSYLWSVTGGEVISRDKNKVEVKWDSDSVGQLIVTNQDLIEDGLLIDSLWVQFSDTGQSKFVLPENIGTNAAVTFVNESVLGQTFNWEVNSVLVSEEIDLTYSFNHAGEYQLNLTSITAEDCKTNSTQKIQVSDKLELVIYNVITANDDGENDVLYVENIERYPDNKVSFYNLDGQLIFEQTGYQNGWLPNKNGTRLSQGSYVCVVTVEGFDQVFKQTVSVLY